VILPKEVYYIWLTGADPEFQVRGGRT
jgi:hypothetical protein